MLKRLDQPEPLSERQAEHLRRLDEIADALDLQQAELEAIFLQKGDLQRFVIDEHYRQEVLLDLFACMLERGDRPSRRLFQYMANELGRYWRPERYHRDVQETQIERDEFYIDQLAKKYEAEGAHDPRARAKDAYARMVGLKHHKSLERQHNRLRNAERKGRWPRRYQKRTGPR